MPKWGYSITEEMLNPDKTAKASGRELKVSHKAAREVAKAIKGMDLAKAKEYLREVIAKNVGSHHGLTGNKGAVAANPMPFNIKCGGQQHPEVPLSKLG